MRKLSFLVLSYLFIFGFSNSADADSRLRDAEKIRAYFGIADYRMPPNLKNIKVAVLDSGFAGMEGKDKYLPASARLVVNYDKKFIERFDLGSPDIQFPLENIDHGRMVAQAVWGITGNDEAGPQFLLLNAATLTSFKRAVRYAIEEKVDIIVYSKNWECCGNFDGKGFINKIVNQATDAGIIWINAAGNYAGKVYNGVAPLKEKEIPFKNSLDENTAIITLSWNAVGEDETMGTDKDLDLFLYDEVGTLVASSELKQVKKKGALVKGKETYLPREKITAQLHDTKGKFYKIVVRARSNNFGPGDRIRVTLLSGKESFFDPEQQRVMDAIDFSGATPGYEIMVPADNPNVITVGDPTEFSSRGPTMNPRIDKPDLLMADSQAYYTDGSILSGTSIAAPYFAGIVAVLKAYDRNLTTNHLLKMAKHSTISLEEARGELKNAGPTIKVVPLDAARKRYPAIFAALGKLLEEKDMRISLVNDTRLVVELPQYPPELQKLFPKFPLEEQRKNLHRYQYFLTVKEKEEVTALVRPTEPIRGRIIPFPWDALRQPVSNFVELRKKSGAVGPSGKKVWKTPTPAEFQAFMR